MKNSLFSIATIIGVFLFLFTVGAAAQTPAGSYVVINKGTVPDLSAYKTAIENADLEGYRYQNQRAVLTFDNGIQIELLSAAELYAMDNHVVVGNYKYEDDPNWGPPVFHLNEDGTLTASYTKGNLKQQANNPR